MSCLEFALAYLEEGFAVLPLSGKQPHTRLIRRTHGGQASGVIRRLAQRTADEDHLREWFSDPRVNVGVFCGEPSGGLVIVDFDDCPFPPAGMSLPLTPTVKTGRGLGRGYHLYYRTETPVAHQSFHWGEVRGWTKGVPLQVVAPPSRHPDTGRRYGWQLPIGEVPFADFDAVQIPGLGLKASPDPSSLTPIRPSSLSTTKAVLLRPGTTADTGEKWWQAYLRDEAVVRAIARSLGVDAPLGHPFPCPLHPERNASACLYRAREGEWLFRDFHASKHGAPEWLTLSQLRAAIAGRSTELSPSEHCTWLLISLVEAGVLQPVQVPARPLPPDVGGAARHVYERFVFLLSCRWNYDYGDPAPFTRDFAAALCNLPERAAREAIEELQRREFLCLAGRHGRSRLWLPAGVEPVRNALQADLNAQVSAAKAADSASRPSGGTR